MGIKDLFNKGYSTKLLKNHTRDTLREEVESFRYIDSYSNKRDRFVPDIDLGTASNFARFGLAEEYYDTAIKRIYQTYPYDGSQAEKIEWENESTYLDLFIFENEYPRTNGFVTFNSGSNTYTSTQELNIYSSSAPQYIFIKGGPHADPGGDYKSDFSAGPSKSGISKANIYHTGSQRTNNLELDLDKGVTIEFWMKKDGWASTDTTKTENFFHLAKSGSTGEAYGQQLRISSRGSSNPQNVDFEILSGSTQLLFTHNVGSATLIADSTWHHYAFTAKTQGTSTVSNLYVDGVHKSTKEDNETINAIGGTMIAALGALCQPDERGSAQYGDLGWGNIVSASFDEFRYWKTERDGQQIGRYWRDQIGGGTNTDNVKYDDVSNFVDLGVYYKFNEGITGNSTTDATILDYSGRISNGTFVNYNSSESRNTGSAIVISQAATKEFKDPIIYSSHPEVSSLYTSKKLSGSFHDHENSVSLYRSLPGWIMEEDEKESNELKYLTQIIASYFDDLYLQIQELPRLKDINYPEDKKYEKTLPFAERLLTTRGFDPPELFAHASALAKYLERDEKQLFERKLYEVKNIIYHNIYNNLSYIQKSKGTFKSLRNFLRCFGVDEELIKLNIYTNDDTYEFKNNHTNIAVRKKYLDFDDSETRYGANGGYANSFTATAFQTASADSNSISYVPGIPSASMSGSSLTLETEVIFPKKELGDKHFNILPYSTSSIIGLHAVVASNTDLTCDPDDKINFNIVATRPDNDKRSVKFGIITSGSSNIISDAFSTDTYNRVYDNEKWNLAFRLRPTKSPLANLISGSLLSSGSAYTYEFYGVNYVSNILQNEFTISGTMSLTDASKYFTKNKRVFMGAARNNFTGSTIAYSDVKVSSTRMWYDYLDNETIRAHAKNANSYGVLNPYKSSNLTVSNKQLFDKFIPQIDTLLFHWGLDNVTGSDASGQFMIPDYTSGSATDVANERYGWFSNISKRNYPATGYDFVSASGYRDQAVDVEYVQTAKQKLPEVANSDDMVKILNKQDDLVFTRDTTYVQHLLSVEKSMYQIMSEEMLRFFATVVNFNNMVGEPLNRYRPHYKRMEKLRELFFERVENEPDLEKFIEYFKWIDDAITIMIGQLIPVSSNTVELLRNMVESHILERNKYWNKFPTMEVNIPEPVGTMHAIEELKYNWRVGHAPVGADQNTNQNTNCLWWKERADRDDVLTSGDTNIDSNKSVILKTIVTEISGATAKLMDNGTAYQESYYPNRSLRRVIDLETNRTLKLKGGSNPHRKQKHDFYKNVTKWASDDDFIFIDMDNELAKKDCDDKFVPDETNKKRVKMTVLTMPAHQITSSDGSATGINDQLSTDGKADLLLPFGIYSSSIDTGYQGLYADQFKIDFTNMHDDKYGFDAEIPMQGPFAEKYVGGMQHRHIDLNEGPDVPLTRPEGWHLQEFLNLGSIEYILYEGFGRATTSPSTDTKVLNLPMGSWGTSAPPTSATGLLDDKKTEPSPHEYWRNGVNADNEWSFLSGQTATAGTGPNSGKYMYCEVLPSKVGQTFGIVTPLIDLTEVDSGSNVTLSFSYLMYGLHIGSLKVQACRYKNFSRGVEDLLVDWNASTSGGQSTVLSGQQHTNGSDTFSEAYIASTTYGNGLANWLGKRFYIRFFYTAGITQQGDIAIDNVIMYKGSGTKQDSFKLFSPTHDNHHRPSAIHTRQEYAKRPVNIRNIHMTGNASNTSTVAGNFLNRYEYVNTISPESNDPFFVKNTSQIAVTSSERVVIAKIEDLLKQTPGTVRSTSFISGTYVDYTLPNRSYISGTVKNRSRIMSRFTSHGGYETVSRGFLDPAHETYSAYNAMTFRNMSMRQVYNTQLQAHCGKFGVSTHDATTARVYGSEVIGTIQAADYTLSGDASKHKIHRNNIERLELTDSDVDIASMTAVTASYYDNGFVSHMIPRTDKQYRWITGSLI